MKCIGSGPCRGPGASAFQVASSRLTSSSFRDINEFEGMIVMTTVILLHNPSTLPSENKKKNDRLTTVLCCLDFEKPERSRILFRNVRITVNITAI